MTPEEKIAHLEGQLKEVREESAERRVKARDHKAAADKAAADLAERDRRIADLEAKQGKPSELQAKITELTAEVRQLKHSARFRDLATAAGVHPEAIDDAWGALKLKAEADEPDEGAMAAALDAARASKPYLFRPAEGDKPSEGDKKPPAAPPAFGAGRGAAAPPGSLKLTLGQRRDAAWMAQNASLINQHRQAGTLVYE